MIYISKTQLNQVEYLIGQSIQGNHVLFDLETIRHAFWSETPQFSPEEAYSVEHHIEKVILQPSLAEKRAYLDQLDQETFKRVVRTYFNIIENNIYENHEVYH